MSKNTTAIRFAITSVLALSGAAFTASAMAADDNSDKEQCAGIIKAGKNDCATATNACHGHVEVDSNPNAWIYVPKGTCERLAGGRVVHVVDPTPKK
jgi:uncharacterized membrane protein